MSRHKCCWVCGARHNRNSKYCSKLCNEHAKKYLGKRKKRKTSMARLGKARSLIYHINGGKHNE